MSLDKLRHDRTGGDFADHDGGRRSGVHSIAPDHVDSVSSQRANKLIDRMLNGTGWLPIDHQLHLRCTALAGHNE
jgi:hypothetical protein